MTCWVPPGAGSPQSHTGRLSLTLSQTCRFHLWPSWASRPSLPPTLQGPTLATLWRARELGDPRATAGAAREEGPGVPGRRRLLHARAKSARPTLSLGDVSVP